MTDPNLPAILAIDWHSPCPIAEGEKLAREDAEKERERERERAVEMANNKAKAEVKKRKAG